MQHFKKGNLFTFFNFCGLFLPSWIRIRTQGSHSILVQSGSVSTTLPFICSFSCILIQFHTVLGIRITLVRIRIRIPLFTLIHSRIWCGPESGSCSLLKRRGSVDQWSQIRHGSILSLYASTMRPRPSIAPFWAYTVSVFWLFMLIRILLLTLGSRFTSLFTLKRIRIQIKLPKMMRIRIRNTVLI